MPIITFVADKDKTVTVVGGAYTLNFVDGGNAKSVTVAGDTYTEFPVDVPVQQDETVTIKGKDDPTITIDYTNTSVPVVTDT